MMRELVSQSVSILICGDAHTFSQLLFDSCV